MSPSPLIPVPPLPRAGQTRAYWRAPASASTLALGLVATARSHPGLVLAVTRDTHAAQSLEAMKGDIALALQQTKNEGAHNVEELKGLVQMLLAKLQPDPAVADGGEDPPGTPEEFTQPA